MNNIKYDGVFEGGGVKGIALIGALKRLEEEEVEFSRIAGTSAGAITAALVSAGYRAGEIKNILWKKDFNEFADIKTLTGQKWYRIIFSRHIWYFITVFLKAFGYGAFDTKNFYRWIRDLLKEKDVTDFKSCPTYLRVFAVDIVKQELLQFDKDCTPDLEVADAIRMSMSIPIFFRAKIKQDAFIVDGGVLANYPIATFGDKEELRTTIGFKLISKDETLPPRVPGNILSYFMRIFETMQVAHERIYVEKAKWARTIPIPTGTISVVKFDLTGEEKQFLWDSGYKAADKAIKEGLLTEQGRQ